MRKAIEKIICPEYPSLCMLILLYTVLNDRQCRSVMIIPATASVLPLGCQGAAHCVNEARVPVSMVTSPTRHPTKQPLFNAITLAGLGEEVGARKEHLQGGGWEIRVDVLLL